MDVVDAVVISNRPETPSVWRLRLRWDARARGARAARFAMLALPDRRLHLLPRPFSISDVDEDAGGAVTEFLYKPVGRFTGLLTGLQEGATLRAGGLCGNGFPEPAPGRRPVLLAGGIGNAPFALQVRELSTAGPFRARPADVVLLLAGRSAADVWIQPAVRRAGVTVVEITEDGTLGERGRVTDALLRRLGELGPIEAFACGPEPMLRAVQAIALEHGFPCHLSVEERMACGYGVCNACVVEERRDGVPRGQGGFLKSCVEGPVFEAREIHA